MDGNVTLYQLADAEIRRCIASYLQLVKDTRGFSIVEESHVVDQRSMVILLAGLGIRNFNVEPSQAVEEWKRRSAVPFDIETAVTTEVYRHIRELGSNFLSNVDTISDGFKNFDPVFIQQNPYLLPIFQHLAGIFSKSKLK